MERYTCFWQRYLTAKQSLHGEKGEKLGWVLTWVGPFALVDQCCKTTTLKISP